jgi:hypothetical protein
MPAPVSPVGCGMHSIGYSNWHLNQNPTNPVDGSVTQRRYRWRVYAAVPRGDVYFCFGVAYVSRSLIGEAREFAASARCYSRVHRYSVRVHSDVYSTAPPLRYYLRSSIPSPFHITFFPVWPGTHETDDDAHHHAHTLSKPNRLLIRKHTSRKISANRVCVSFPYP